MPDEISADISRKYVRRAFVKKVIRIGLAIVTITGLVYGILTMVYASRTIYKVKMNYAIVLEKLGGKRVAVPTRWRPGG